MIVNGASRRSVAFWSRHLANDKKNDRAELIDIRGLAATSLKDALLEMQEDARHTRCENFFYQANFNPCAHEHLTEEQWEQTFEIFEKHRGIPSGTPRIVYEHEKEGRVHRHVIWSRIDLENMRAWPDQLDAKVCHAASREISETLGLERTASPYDKDREGPRPERAPDSYEMFRGLRSGLDPREIKAEVTGIFRSSENAADFVAGLEQHGYQMVRGDKRDFCIVDAAGDVHSLARRLEGVNAKQLREFMRGFDRNRLPSIEDAKWRQAERRIDDKQDELDAVRREIAWEEALAQAAIQKEMVEERFVEPTRQEIREGGRREKKWPLHAPVSEKTTTSPLHHFEDAAPSASRSEPVPVKAQNLKGPAAQIWEAYQGSDSTEAFASALAAEGITLAAVSKEEAARSARVAAFARETGRFAPTYREGEIVAIAEPPLAYKDGQLQEPAVHQLNRRSTGDRREDIERYLESVDRSQLEGIEATKAALKERVEKRIAEVQVFRENLRDVRSTERLAEAAQTKDGRHGESLWRKAGGIVNSAEKGAEATMRGFGAVGRAAESLLNILDPILTPAQRLEQRLKEAEQDADALKKLDLGQFTKPRIADETIEKRDRERDR
jgi:hypothetical protein